MYHLAKLLTEEPEKLERLVILFFKLLITLFIGNALFGMNISISAFVDNPIPQDYTVSKLILFLIILVVIWFVVWSLISELILAELFIRLLSKIGNKQEVFISVLNFFGIVKWKKDSRTPNKNIISFYKMISEYNEDDEKIIIDGKIRLRQYYIVTTAVYSILLLAHDVELPSSLKWFGALMIINFLLGNIIFNQAHIYFKENFDQLKKEFGQLAYSQMISNCIDQIPQLKNNYEKEVKRKFIYLKRKSETNSLPDTLNFFHFYHWNVSLLQTFLDKELKQRIESGVTKQFSNHYDVIIANVEPNESIIKSILNLQGFAYLYCEDEENIYINLELLLFKISNNIY